MSAQCRRHPPRAARRPIARPDAGPSPASVILSESVIPAQQFLWDNSGGHIIVKGRNEASRPLCESRPREHVRASAVRRIECALACSITVILIGCHVLSARNAGGLWRDEVNTLNMAKLPSAWSIFLNTDKDSFPIVYFVILKAWRGLLGDSDLALRSLSVVIGGSVLGILWWYSRLFRRGVPLVSLLLVGASPTVFRFANGIRAYQLAMAFLLITLGLIGLLVENPTKARFSAAVVAGTLSVQTHWVNAFMLLGICAGAGLVLLKRKPKVILLLGLVGAPAALSLLPYVPTFRTHADWCHLDRLPTAITMDWFCARLAEAVDFWLPNGLMSLVWLCLLGVCVGVFGYRLGRSTAGGAGEDRALRRIATLACCFLCFVAYIKLLRMPTTLWYYVPLIGVSAVLIEDGLQSAVGASLRRRIVRIVAVMIIATCIAPGVWKASLARWSNVNLIAERLTKDAQERDYILVHPWYVGVTFCHYYRGQASWSTLPEFENYQFQDHRPLIAQMMKPNPIDSILNRIEDTLRSGGRVWFVGSLADLGLAEVPARLEPSIDGGRTGPTDVTYMAVWNEEVTALLRSRGKATRVPIVDPKDRPVLNHEELELHLIEKR